MKTFEKQSAGRPSPIQALVYHALWVIVFALFAVLLAGTVYGLIKRAGKGGAEGAAGEAEAAAAETQEGIFSGIGTIRVSTAGDEPAVLVVSVEFPYNKNDRPFAEELVSRIGDFKAEASNFLGGFTAEELRNSDISAINKELLGRYNALLRLGQIKELYFLDFIWL